MNRNVFFFLTELIYSVIEACAPQIIRLRPPLSDELEMLLLNVNETQSQSCSICKRSRFLFYLPAGGLQQGDMEVVELHSSP